MKRLSPSKARFLMRYSERRLKRVSAKLIAHWRASDAPLCTCAAATGPTVLLTIGSTDASCPKAARRAQARDVHGMEPQ